MTEVNGELINEILKPIQQDLAGLKEGQREHTAALNALRTHVLALQQDQANIYSILVRHESRLDRIQRRSNIAEAPA
jgi:hypothetical protein